ncbi:phospholipid/diacylglycerol acyltransferase [Chlamydoabsidia padenii]|nr:phospholipid/diacylglycerol acyltransferase [Chlamydoabsidia padenii]
MQSWSTRGKTKKFFRKHIWGTFDMIRILLTDKATWKEAMKLDEHTGLDPKDIKLRPVDGFAASERIFPGYWLWSKVIQNLSAIGYDSNNMYIASYDWRLALGNLEKRDHYFSRLKSHIEGTTQGTGRKSVVIGHSMGSTVLYYFLKWVESPEGGNGGDQWVENNIEHFVNIGGALLGVPKALPSLLSGENRDILTMGKVAFSVFERFLCQRERMELFRNWVSAAMMLPKGGNVIWGDENGAPDDEIVTDGQSKKVLGSLISFASTGIHQQSMGKNVSDNNQQYQTPLLNHTVEMAMDLFINTATPEYASILQNNYSFGITTSKKQLEANEHLPRTWSNPLEARLPNAPSMKVYCLYGVGIMTERSYVFGTNDVRKQVYENDNTCQTFGDVPDAAGTTSPMSLFIDTTITDHSQNIDKGVRLTNGDKTVPIISNGYMCAPSGGWVKHADLYNPGRSQVIGREYKNRDTKEPKANRGAPTSARHVEILGNTDLLLDILQIVSNHSEKVTSRTFSHIETIAQRVSLEHQD